MIWTVAQKIRIFSAKSHRLGNQHSNRNLISYPLPHPSLFHVFLHRPYKGNITLNVWCVGTAKVNGSKSHVSHVLYTCPWRWKAKYSAKSKDANLNFNTVTGKNSHASIFSSFPWCAAAYKNMDYRSSVTLVCPAFAASGADFFCSGIPWIPSGQLDGFTRLARSSNCYSD